MSGWAILWCLWVLSGVAIEIVALSNSSKNDTLSENIWSLTSHPTIGKFALWMLVSFLAWLIFHFATRGKF